MAPPVFTNPIGGLSPLGKITVAVPNTSVPLNTNVTAQSQSATKGRTNRMRQLIIAASPKNTGSVYLVWSPFNKTNSTVVFDEIPPGVSRSYPQGSWLEHASLNIDYFSLDADVANEGAYCSVIWG